MSLKLTLLNALLSVRQEVKELETIEEGRKIPEAIQKEQRGINQAIACLEKPVLAMNISSTTRQVYKWIGDNYPNSRTNLSVTETKLLELAHKVAIGAVANFLNFDHEDMATTVTKEQPKPLAQHSFAKIFDAANAQALVTVASKDELLIQFNIQPDDEEDDEDDDKPTIVWSGHVLMPVNLYGMQTINNVLASIAEDRVWAIVRATSGTNIVL